MKLLADLDMSGLEQLVASMDEPKYRAKQLMRHITAYDGCDGITDLPKTFVKQLSESYVVRALTEKTRVVAADGAVRYLFETQGGDLIESVFLPHGYGNSVCVSCQVGCARSEERRVGKECRL